MKKKEKDFKEKKNCIEVREVICPSRESMRWEAAREEKEEEEVEKE
jgi:hypothetical protein